MARVTHVGDPDDVLDLPDGPAWEAWLEAHHDRAAEAWLRIAKKGSGLARISIGDALDGALCFGWIDGQRRGLDDLSFLQRYCPRRARSSWSQVNVDKVERLICRGSDAPVGPGRGRGCEALTAGGTRRTSPSAPPRRRATSPPPWRRTTRLGRRTTPSEAASATP